MQFDEELVELPELALDHSSPFLWNENMVNNRIMDLMV